MIETVVGLVGGAALLLGLTLATIGLYGMLRRPAIFDQLHAAGLISGSGVILVLLASLATGSAEIATSGLLVVAFVLITSSLSTHAIALAAWRDAASARPGGSWAGPAVVPPAAMRVVLAHDGSDGAAVATSFAASVPWTEGSSIRLVLVTEGGLRPFPSEAASARHEPASAGLREVIDAAATSLRRPGLAIDEVTVQGDAAAAIATEATAFGADLVVIGSRGLGPVRSILLGSIAPAVIDAAPCPVLVARVPVARSALVAVDAAGTGDAAIDAVARWPMFHGVRIVVVNVATAAAAEDGADGDVAEAAATRLRAAGRSAVSIVRTGDAATRILEVARAEAADVIVLGSRGQTGVRRAFLGSVGRSVVSSADVSVLVVEGRASRGRPAPEPHENARRNLDH